MHNFRCYVHNSFEFPNTGLVLLSGVSGAGKSSILKAILFALYGSKAVKKPCRFGTSSCKVELEISNLKITRTNKPNRLLVDSTNSDISLEDESAQHHINSEFGNFEAFNVSSYIPQKNNKSILSLAQMEQMSILRALAVDPDVSESHKFKIKNRCKELSTEITKIQTRIDLLESQTSDFTQTPEPQCPSSTKFKNAKDCRREITDMDSKISSLLQQKEQLLEITMMQSNLDDLIERRDELGESCGDNVNINDIQKKKQHITYQMTECKQRQQIYSKIERRNELQRKMETLSQKILDPIDEIDIENQILKINETVENHKKYTKYISKLRKICGAAFDRLQTQPVAVDAYKKRITKLKKRIEIIQSWLDSQKLLECPNCNVKLKWDVGDTAKKQLIMAESTKLSESTVYTESDLHEATTKLADIQNKLIRVNDLGDYVDDPPEKTDIDHLQIKCTELQEMVSKNKKLKHECEYLNRDINTLAAQISEADIDMDIDLPSIDDLYTQLSDLKTIIVKLEQLQALDTKISNVRDKLNDLRSESINMTDNSADIDGKLSEIKTKKTEITEILPVFQKWDDYCIQADKNADLLSRLYTERENLANTEQTQTGWNFLRDKYAEAEILMMHDVCKNINVHTNYYLDYFFANDITASIELVATEKKAKSLKLTTNIAYNGYEYDGITQLSGGEFDRCTLASICGINSMLGSNILILDESLSALDATTNMEIIQYLSGLSTDKLILICSHEAVSGIFDEIITVGVDPNNPK